MADTRIRPVVVFKPGVSGITIALTGGIFLAVGLVYSSPPVVLIGAGLLTLAAASLLFLLVALPFVVGRFRTLRSDTSMPPPSAFPGKATPVRLDPPRPGFLPGVRLSAGWRMKFGPFDLTPEIPLQSGRDTSGSITIPRRGRWEGPFLLRMSDPFGLFGFLVLDRKRHRIDASPDRRGLSGQEIPGHPSRMSTTAPRPKEDAEERLERRDYRPGDDTRRLDWKQLARTGELLVRIGEDSVPLQGRTWIDVPALWASPRRRPGPVRKHLDRQRIERLDDAILLAEALVDRLRETGQEVLVRLPGESGWTVVEPGSWPGRLAASLPVETLDESTGTLPPSGERLWLIGYPEDREVGDVALAAKAAGCKVGLGLPVPAAPGKHPLRSNLRHVLFSGDGPPVMALLRRRRKALENLTDQASAAGIDVRFF